MVQLPETKTTRRMWVSSESKKMKCNIPAIYSNSELRNIIRTKVGVAGTSFKCSMVQLDGPLVPHLGMPKRNPENVLLLVLATAAFRFVHPKMNFAISR